MEWGVLFQNGTLPWSREGPSNPARLLYCAP